MNLTKQVIHISEAQAASEFVSLLARVRAGAEVVIEHDSQPVAVVHGVPPARRTISESIALAKEHERKLGYTPTLDADFAADLEAIINSHREPLSPPPWD